MSLLIDALKQAEAARAQAQSVSPPATESIELEPLSQDPKVTPQQPVDTQLSRPSLAESNRRTRPQRPASNSIASDATRELFEIKRPPPSRLPLILAGLAILVVAGGAGYVWWAIQPRSSLVAKNFSSDDSKSGQAPVAPLIEIRRGTSPPPVVAEEALAPPNPQVDAATPPPPARNNTRRDAFRSNSPGHVRERGPLLNDDSQPQIRNNPATETRDASGIQAAYSAFLAGNLVVARQRYQDVLRQDPRNVDAMNALGLIAWRSGQPDVAERMFRAAVGADPKDVTATSQLALLYAEGDPTSSESRLRNLIASQPAAAAPYYALGSLLARQQRWNEAQQALFQAYTLDSENPDVLFNLAISLEHLAQSSVARQFYERALQAAARRPASFDKGVAQDRVQALGNPQAR